MKIFVTGGTGFLGREIVRQLCAEGHDVVTFSRGNYPIMEGVGVRHFKGDLSDYNSLKKAMKECEAVFHVAAKTGIWGKYKDFYTTNVTGTLNVIRACRECRISNLVFTSSPSVVFNGKDSEGHNESMPYPLYYNAWYPETKAFAEELVMGANDASLKTVSLRPHLIWGPDDPHFLPRLFRKAKASKLRLIGNKPKLIDSIYIDNAAKAHLQAFEQMLRDPSTVEGKTYFISQGEPIPTVQLMNRLLAAGGLPPVTKYISPNRALLAGMFLEKTYRIFGISAEPEMTVLLAQQLSTSHWYDISAAKKDFGYRPEISLEEGMDRLRAWLSKDFLLRL